MKATLFLILLLITQLCVAQSYSDIANEKSGNYSQAPTPVIGLWKVDNVSVGNEALTPTAKWFLFQPAGEYETGNGWVQNGLGTYNFDSDKQELWQAINGEADPKGAFTVSMDEETMTWRRWEEGMEVIVSLSRTKEKPLAPWDMIQGNWTIQKAEGYDKDSGELKSEYMLDPERYYLGWDRRYRKYDKNDQPIETGLWHIEAHSNWLWTISDKDNTKTGYAIEIKGDNMTWTKDGETEKLKIIFQKN